MQQPFSMLSEMIFITSGGEIQFKCDNSKSKGNCYLDWWQHALHFIIHEQLICAIKQFSCNIQNSSKPFYLFRELNIVRLCYCAWTAKAFYVLSFQLENLTTLQINFAVPSTYIAYNSTYWLIKMCNVIKESRSLKTAIH